MLGGVGVVQELISAVAVASHNSRRSSRRGDVRPITPLVSETTTKAGLDVYCCNHEHICSLRSAHSAAGACLAALAAVIGTVRIFQHPIDRPLPSISLTF
jgi:hypothetical protein